MDRSKAPLSTEWSQSVKPNVVIGYQISKCLVPDPEILVLPHFAIETSVHHPLAFCEVKNSSDKCPFIWIVMTKQHKEPYHSNLGLNQNNIVSGNKDLFRQNN
jgi:hypothetical protein